MFSESQLVLLLLLSLADLFTVLFSALSLIVGILKNESSCFWEGNLFHVKRLKSPVLSVAEGQCGAGS